MYSDLPLFIQEIYESGDMWAISHIEFLLD